MPLRGALPATPTPSGDCVNREHDGQAASFIHGFRLWSMILTPDPEGIAEYRIYKGWIEQHMAIQRLSASGSPEKFLEHRSATTLQVKLKPLDLT